MVLQRGKRTRRSLLKSIPLRRGQPAMLNAEHYERNTPKMKVLFVDDEPRVLEALERALRIARVGWEMSFATSGEAALAVLEANRYDVIVSDMRMPGMDGAALLAAAFERDPAMARVVLSGQAEEAAALRVIHVAHQFLSKPCDTKLLRHVVERSGLLQPTLADPNLRAMLGSVDRLPSS